MDPEACLRRIEDAASDGDRDEMRDAAADLREWIEKGGFLPDGVDGERGQLAVRLLAVIEKI